MLYIFLFYLNFMVVPKVCWFEMYEQVIKIFSIELIWSSMKQPRTLVPDHVTRLEDDGVVLASIVQQMEVPVIGNRLANVHDGWHHIILESVNYCHEKSSSNGSVDSKVSVEQI